MKLLNCTQTRICSGFHSYLQFRQSFTLIELLVVISIISILASMLLPALKSARTMAQRSQCSSNVKNLCAATNVYEMDFGSMYYTHGTSEPQYATPFPGDTRNSYHMPVSQPVTFFETYLNGKCSSTTSETKGFVIDVATSKMVLCPAAAPVTAKTVSTFHYVPWCYSYAEGDKNIKITMERLIRLNRRINNPEATARTVPAIWGDRNSAWWNGNSMKYYDITNHSHKRGAVNGGAANYGYGMNVGFGDGSVTWREINQYTGKATPSMLRSDNNSYYLMPYEGGVYWIKNGKYYYRKNGFENL